MTSIDLRDRRSAVAAALGMILAIVPLAGSRAVTAAPENEPGCEVADASCDVHEIIVQQVVGSGMTIDGSSGGMLTGGPGLDGAGTNSIGMVSSITIRNARGTGAGWDLTGYVVGAAARSGPSAAWTEADHLTVIPSAQVIHDRISGDTAHVAPGPTMIVPDPARTARSGDASLLCSAPDEQSGGTFRCDVSVWLEVSDGAADLAGSLVLTLV